MWCLLPSEKNTGWLWCSGQSTGAGGPRSLWLPPSASLCYCKMLYEQLSNCQQDVWQLWERYFGRNKASGTHSGGKWAIDYDIRFTVLDSKDLFDSDDTALKARTRATGGTLTCPPDLPAYTDMAVALAIGRGDQKASVATVSSASDGGATVPPSPAKRAKTTGCSA